LSSARAGLSPKTRRGREKEEKKTTKEGGLLPQEGDVRRFKKRKRPRKARRWLREGKVPCVLNQEFLFLVHKYLGSERPVSFEYRLLRGLIYEEAMCEGSSGNGLPYAVRAVP
jgi:hypothetical protein